MLERDFLTGICCLRSEIKTVPIYGKSPAHICLKKVILLQRTFMIYSWTLDSIIPSL